MEMEDKLLVFNIQKYSLHDGSGIRTVVFLKGCPLRCRWCSNPESQYAKPEIMYRRSLCLGREKCGLCEKVSPGNCISYDDEGKAVPAFEHRESGGEWAEVCPTKALFVKGKYMRIDEILETVERDAAFYRNGNGGITLSGGEPLLQGNTVKLLKKAKEQYLHTAIETCGAVDKERLLEALPFLDEVFYDIKSLNEEKHLKFTGVSIERICDNLKTVCREYPDRKITVRTPVIPGFNDREEELNKIESFLNDFRNVSWERLPYHTYGVAKYEMLGRRYSLNESEAEERGHGLF